jgi:hypothetical protein
MLQIPPLDDPTEGMVVGWLIFAPLLFVVAYTASLAWRQTSQAQASVRIPIRSFYLAYFLAPSLVGAIGHTGGFLLPGPAFLMLTFGQWNLKLALGAIPILICWPIACAIYSLKHRSHRRQQDSR